MSAWKDVVGYEGLYEVNRLGEVRSVDRVVTFKRKGRVDQKRLKGKVLSVKPDPFGYTTCSLCRGGKVKAFRVHRIVAIAWLGTPPEGCEVCHGPNGKTDNSVDNLRWDTRSANVRDCYRDGNGIGKPVRRSDGVEYLSLNEAAKDTGCWAQNIGQVCKGKNKMAGGYGWSYINE